MTASRSILVAAHYYPPCTDTGAHRPATMVKYLRRLGHRVTVLTTSAYGRFPDDDERGIVRTFDLQLVQARLRRRTQAQGQFDTGTYSNRWHPLSYVLIPDAFVLAWAPFAVARAIRIARREKFDCVITTSPPESTHMVGHALRRRGIPWVADVRDGWVYESLRPDYPIGLQHRLDRTLERRWLAGADVTTAVVNPLVKDLRERLGANAALVPNGWDPELLETIADDGKARSHLDPDRVSIVYTGKLASARRDPTPLIDALRELARDDPATAERLEVVFAGSFTEDERRLLATDISPARISVIASVPRPEALAMQRSADVLLVLAAGARRQEASKVPEYLGAERPILALADGTAAGEIVRETGSGTVVAALDVGEIKSALKRVVNEGIETARTDGARAYSYPAVAERMAERIEEAISRARGPEVSSR